MTGSFSPSIARRCPHGCRRRAAKFVATWFTTRTWQLPTPETGKLVCYDCGVACDLSNMKSERVSYLTTLGADEPRPPQPKVMRAALRKGKGKDRELPTVNFAEKPSRRFRLRYTKLGRSMYLGHLDTSRVLARLFRRAQIEIAYSRGF